MQQGVLAVSRRGGVAHARRAGVAGGRAESPTPVCVEGTGLLVASWGGLDLAARPLAAEPGAEAPRARAQRREVAALLDAGDVAGLAEVLPAFAAVRRTAPDTAVAVTDALGFRHLYHAQGTGWSAVSHLGAACWRCSATGRRPGRPLPAEPAGLAGRAVTRCSSGSPSWRRERLSGCCGGETRPPDGRPARPTLASSTRPSSRGRPAPPQPDGLRHRPPRRDHPADRRAGLADPDERRPARAAARL